MCIRDREYGSPKKPALIEALALNFADNTDAKLQTMTEILNGAGDNQGWLGYNLSLIHIWHRRSR